MDVGSAWVTRREDNQFQVLSTICPHLGCAISHQSDHFLCPCHGSFFSEAGQRQEPDGKANPSPRGMDALQWKVKDNQLWIQYERFEQGTDKRISLTRKQEA